MDLSVVFCEDKSAPAVPDRYGLSVLYGHTYDPHDNIGFAMLSGFALFDYEKVWHHRAPAPLRFKVECSVGAATQTESGLVASAGVLALYYLHRISSPSVRPYVEAGIGGIYTDFKVQGQGLRFNFNPQAGIGVEFDTHSQTFLAAVRLHHISNGGLNHENRGVNSVVFMLGRFF